MEYYNAVANNTVHFTFMWSGKFNNNSLKSQGKSGSFYQTEWEPKFGINNPWSASYDVQTGLCICVNCYY